MFVPREGKGNEPIRHVARSLGYNVRVLPVVRPVDQVAMDYDRIIAFVNSHDETTKGQIQHAHKITKVRGTILYVFDIEKKQWCTTDTTEPTLYPRTMTLVTILDNTDDRIDMSIEAIGFLFRCQIRDSLSVLRFEKQKIEMPSMVIDVSTCCYAMEETLRREAFFLLGPRLQFATAGTAVGTIEGKPFSPSTIPTTEICDFLKYDLSNKVIVFGQHSTENIAEFYKDLMKRAKKSTTKRVLFQHNISNSLYCCGPNGEPVKPPIGQTELSDHLTEGLRLVGTTTSTDVNAIIIQLGRFVSTSFFYNPKRKMPNREETRNKEKKKRKTKTTEPTQSTSILKWLVKRPSQLSITNNKTNLNTGKTLAID